MPSKDVGANHGIARPAPQPSDGIDAISVILRGAEAEASLRARRKAIAGPETMYDLPALRAPAPAAPRRRTED